MTSNFTLSSLELFINLLLVMKWAIFSYPFQGGVDYGSCKLESCYTNTLVDKKGLSVIAKHSYIRLTKQQRLLRHCKYRYVGFGIGLLNNYENY